MSDWAGGGSDLSLATWTWWRVCVFATSMTKVGKASGPRRYWVGSNPSSGSLAPLSGWIDSDRVDPMPWSSRRVRPIRLACSLRWSVIAISAASCTGPGILTKRRPLSAQPSCRAGRGRARGRVRRSMRDRRPAKMGCRHCTVPWVSHVLVGEQRANVPATLQRPLPARSILFGGPRGAVGGGLRAWNPRARRPGVAGGVWGKRMDPPPGDVARDRRPAKMGCQRLCRCRG